MAKLLDFIPGYKPKPSPIHAAPVSKIKFADDIEKLIAGYSAPEALVVCEVVIRRLRVREIEEALLAATPPEGAA
jgi:hypothetical protein